MTDTLFPAFLAALGMAFLAGAVVGAMVERKRLARLLLRMARRIAEQSALLGRKAEKERGEKD